jgi:hypothetical protein
MEQTDQESIAEWFLEVEGNKTGPYTAEQILGLLTDGEILSHHRITSERVGNEWITAAELASVLQKDSTTPQTEQTKEIPGPGTFQPPPRPADIEKPRDTELTTDNSPDPAISLFDTLQVARDRKAAKFAPPAPAAEWSKISKPRWKPKPQFWFILGSSIFLILAVWGLTKLVSGRKSDSPAGNERSYKNSFTPPGSNTGPGGLPGGTTGNSPSKVNAFRPGPNGAPGARPGLIVPPPENRLPRQDYENSNPAVSGDDRNEPPPPPEPLPESQPPPAWEGNNPGPGGPMPPPVPGMPPNPYGATNDGPPPPPPPGEPIGN